MLDASRFDVSIVMPCLNEVQSLPFCIENARDALALIQSELGLSGEIVVSDNGSTDGSQLVARAHGARVVDAPERGYGAALIAGFRGASGRYLVMGDCDGSYDFCQAVELVRRLRDGADLAMGSRFKGGIAPGAMPWKNRYIGNPILTGVLNIFFRSGVSDAHCGLRALTQECFERLGLGGAGMEFASEMIVKAALKGEKIAEAPVTLARDIRDRPPHLRPWRDGWRHLRYLFMLSPTWAFAVPALVAAALSLGIWSFAAVEAFAGGSAHVGNYWIILAGALLSLSHMAGLLAAAAHMHGRRLGHRIASPLEMRFENLISLETMLMAGALAFAAGLAVLLSIVGYWSQRNFGPIANVLPAVLGTTLVAIGAQNALGGFLLAIINGHKAEFLKETKAPPLAQAIDRDADKDKEFARAAGC
jgi:glycosyltransferase involved in cell wall biosynthesis